MKVGTSLYTRVYIRCTYFFCTPFVYPARGHNVFVLSNSRDHRFSHPSPTFKNERKKFLLPSILSLLTFTSFNLIFSYFSICNLWLSNVFHQLPLTYLLLSGVEPGTSDLQASIYPLCHQLLISSWEACNTN
jgi:hypothetical protein